MLGQHTHALQSGDSGPLTLHTPMRIEDDCGCATLVLHRSGKILSCGSPAEMLFGASHARLMGRSINQFVAGLFINGSSPSFSARRLVYLCAEKGWSSFMARNIAGHQFPVEIKLSRMNSAGNELFMLNIRRPDVAG